MMDLRTSLRTLCAASLVLALGALASVGARAEEPLPPTSQFFDEYDANSDGAVTADEFRGSGEIFKLLDKNGDGRVTPDELGLPADFKPDPKRKRPAPGAEAGADRGRGKGADRQRKFRERLQQMDADKDGRVSKEEWKGPPEAFDRMDRNKDGFLDGKDRRGREGREGRPGQEGRGRPGRDGAGGAGSPSEEMKAKVKERAAAQFAKMDANKDGKITADETPSPVLLELADNDGDGSITLAELQQVLLQRATRRGGGGGDAGRQGGRRGRLNPGMLKRWDTDKDGKVSKAEFPGREEMFARLDRDGDGFLSEADLQRPAKGAPDGKDGGKGPVTKSGGNVIETMDTDGDGRLHRAEFRGGQDDWVRLDRNKDGWITADELVPAPAK